jgi:hypothetical protein
MQKSATGFISRPALTTAAKLRQTLSLIISFKGLQPGEYKPFESKAKTVKLDASAHEAVQLKAIPVEEMEKQ